MSIFWDCNEVFLHFKNQDRPLDRCFPYPVFHSQMDMNQEKLTWKRKEMEYRTSKTSVKLKSKNQFYS